MATSKDKDEFGREDPKGETYVFPKVEGVKLPSEAGDKGLDRAIAIASSVGSYTDIEEIVPSPFIVNPWGGEFEKEVEYRINLHNPHSFLIFFENQRCFHLKNFILDPDRKVNKCP